MKWRYSTTELVYMQKTRDLIGWRCNLDFDETLEQSTNGKFKGLGDLQGSQNWLPILPLHTSVKAFPALVRTPAPDNFTNPPSVNIFLTMPNVPYITIRTTSLSSLELALHFISPPWKRLSSNIWILFSANKKNSFTPWRSPKPLKLSIGLLFQCFYEVKSTSSTNDNSPFLIAYTLSNWPLL